MATDLKLMFDVPISSDALLATAYALRAAEAQPVNDLLKAIGKPPLTRQQIMRGYRVILSVDLAEGIDTTVRSRWMVSPLLDQRTAVILLDEDR